MEDASKALLISAEVLIGVIIISIMVMLFNRMIEISDVYHAKTEAQKITAFNIEYLQYETENNADKGYLTAEEVVTLINKVHSWNMSTEDGNEEITLTIDRKYYYFTEMK